MSVKTTVNGKEATLEMDFDKVVEYELEHPDWSIVECIGHATESRRITDMNLITSFLMLDKKNLGEDYLSCLRSGIKVDDIVAALREGLVLLGFISEAAQSTE